LRPAVRVGDPSGQIDENAAHRCARRVADDGENAALGSFLFATVWNRTVLRVAIVTPLAITWSALAFFRIQIAGVCAIGLEGECLFSFSASAGFVGSHTRRENRAASSASPDRDCALNGPLPPNVPAFYIHVAGTSG